MRVAAFATAVLLAGVSGFFSVSGLGAIFQGAPIAVIVMGAAMELAKLVTVPWLGTRDRRTRRSLTVALIAMVAVLMAINAVGVFGFLARAHLDHITAARAEVGTHEAAASADVEVARARVTNLDTQIAQIDHAVSEATRRGRTKAAMQLAADHRKVRDALSAERVHAAKVLADLQVTQSVAAGERERLAADVGPVRYLAVLVAGPSADLEHAVRLLTLAVVVTIDPLGVLLLLAAVA